MHQQESCHGSLSLTVPDFGIPDGVGLQNVEQFLLPEKIKKPVMAVTKNYQNDQSRWHHIEKWTITLKNYRSPWKITSDIKIWQSLLKMISCIVKWAVTLKNYYWHWKITDYIAKWSITLQNHRSHWKITSHTEKLCRKMTDYIKKLLLNI